MPADTGKSPVVREAPWRVALALLAFAATAHPAGLFQAPPAPPEKALPDAAQLEREGAIIGEVSVHPGKIFNPADPEENRALFRLADKLHIRTQSRVIRQQLLFQPGGRYSQRKLDESERILRSARYLYDASVRPIAYKEGRVAVSVATRDVWTLNPGVSFGRRGGKNTSGIEIEELNLLGTGAGLSLTRKSGVDRDSTLIKYRNPHLAGTRATLDAAYASNSDGSVRSFGAARPFYALDARWAAGVELLEDEHIEPLYDRGRVVAEFRSHQQFASASWGWSRGLENGWVRRWTFGAAFDERRFSSATAAAAVSLVPEDRKLVYPWLGFDLIEDDFYKFSNHDQIGRTEDFYLGARVGARLGRADTAYGADRNALILSATAGHGSGTSDHSTVLMTGAIKGRLESGELRNTVLDGAVRYYLKQSAQRLLFATLSASAGRALDADTQILLGGDNGLRGYPLRFQSGEARVLLTAEQRYFTNWYPLRLFRVGGAVFFDIGRIWGATPVSTPGEGLLKDVGFGLRIGNSRSGLGNIIHIDLAFPLDGDSSISDMQLLVETKERF